MLFLWIAWVHNHGGQRLNEWPGNKTICVNNGAVHANLVMALLENISPSMSEGTAINKWGKKYI